jgi:hypothetical protein
MSSEGFRKFGVGDFRVKMSAILDEDLSIFFYDSIKFDIKAFLCNTHYCIFVLLIVTCIPTIHTD